MIPLPLQKIAEIIDAKTSQDLPDLMIESISIDSRNIEKNSLFVAFKGENFDAHNFVNQAIESGAIAVIVERKISIPVPQLLVDDAKIALGKIAKWVRNQMPAKIVALTGSSGKTSVKEMCATILSEIGKTLSTKGNLNNDIGVPLTLLNLEKSHEFAVIELGANHIGEIQYSVNLTKPQSALINNIAGAHLAGFGSINGVAKAKGEIFLGLSEKGIAILNHESHSFETWEPMLKQKKIWWFSINASNQVDFYAKNVELDKNGTKFTLVSPNGEIEIQLPLLGLHNVSNALAATALAMSVGANLNAVQKGLAKIKPIKGRLFPFLLKNDCLILDDTYNANLSSMQAAADVLALTPNYRVMIIGDIGELGDYAEEQHRKLGKYIENTNINELLSLGSFSEFATKETSKGIHFSSKDALVTYLVELIKKHKKVTLLFKGSRSTKMETIIDQLKNRKIY